MMNHHDVPWFTEKKNSMDSHGISRDSVSFILHWVIPSGSLVYGLVWSFTRGFFWTTAFIIFICADVVVLGEKRRRGCPTSGPLDVFLFHFCMAINILWLVASNMAFIFHNIWDVILPIDIHIFQRGSNHQPVLFLHPGHWSPYVRISMVRSAAGCSDERCQRERLREWIGGAAAEGGRHHGFWVLVMLSAYWQALIFTSLNRSTYTYVYIAGDTQVYRYCICVEWCGYECLLVKLMQFSTKWFLLKAQSGRRKSDSWNHETSTLAALSR